MTANNGRLVTGIAARILTLHSSSLTFGSIFSFSLKINEFRNFVKVFKIKKNNAVMSKITFQTLRMLTCTGSLLQYKFFHAVTKPDLYSGLIVKYRIGWITQAMYISAFSNTSVFTVYGAYAVPQVGELPLIGPATV